MTEWLSVLLLIIVVENIITNLLCGKIYNAHDSWNMYTCAMWIYCRGFSRNDLLIIIYNFYNQDQNYKVFCRMYFINWLLNSGLVFHKNFHSSNMLVTWVHCCDIHVHDHLLSESGLKSFDSGRPAVKMVKTAMMKENM